MSILCEDNKDLLDRTKKIYLDKQTLWKDSEDDFSKPKSLISEDDPFYNFMSHDEHEVIKTMKDEYKT